ncbi:low-density lipoprotein receptor class A domain-containing protein 2 [Balaenoptera musculus]|uniref:Low-density lipoprotein receptor class A domain-containing protein 2 n=1 Tax=Balaenoptera musculus TaxID=9771 RepID=A0A8B8VJC6_BALMU|nr:low-density lipoprotein receptor class A domain-containing protein 2 [Balaenoptera musculus]
MALARGLPPEPGRPGCRSRLHRRPNGLRHLPAMRTRRSLSQLASQSPVRASAWAPARAPAPDPHDRPQSASADTRHPPHPQTLEVYSPPRWAHARSQQSLRLPRLWPDGRRKGKPLVETLATSSPALQGKRPQLLSRIAFCAPLVFQAGTSRAKVCLFLLSDPTLKIRQVFPIAGHRRAWTEACPLQLPQRLLLLGATSLTASALHTADLVDLCGRTWQGDGLLLRSHSASRRFYFVAPDTDCRLWMLAAAPGDRIRFQFRFFLVYSLTPAAPNASSPAPEDPCAPGSYLQFYEGPPGAPRPLGARLCGLTISGPVASSGDFLGLRLVTRGRQPRVDFVGEVSSFRLGSCCAYFRCQNSRCIPPSLVCDPWGMDNCGYGSDQASWPAANCRELLFPTAGPSPVPSQEGSMDDGTSRPLTLPPARGSPGPLGTAAERSPPARRDPARQDAAPEGPRLRGWRWPPRCS